MNPLERLNWLQAEIDLLVGRYQKDSREYKKLAFRLKIVSVLLAAIVTVLLGLKLENEAMTAAFSNGAEDQGGARPREAPGSQGGAWAAEALSAPQA
jgi:hypothetical protein